MATTGAGVAVATGAGCSVGSGVGVAVGTGVGDAGASVGGAVGAESAGSSARDQLIVWTWPAWRYEGSGGESAAAPHGAGRREAPQVCDADGGPRAPGHRGPEFLEAAGANRRFDQPERRLSESGGDGEADGQQLDAIDGDVGTGPGEHEDRPVPEVDAVRARAEPDQRPPPEEAADQRRLRVHGRGDQRGGQRGDDEKAAAVEERPIVRGGDGHGDKARQGSEAPGVGGPRRVRGDASRQAAGAPDEGERGAGEDDGDAGVGAVVNARGVESGLEEQRHECG